MCILISKDIRCYKVELVRDDLTLLSRSECELICFDVTLGTNKYRFVAVYRPPCSSFKNRDSIHSGVARHNFKRRQLSPPLPKKGVREFRKFLEFCIAVGSFWYIFGEIKPTFLSPKTGI